MLLIDCNFYEKVNRELNRDKKEESFGDAYLVYALIAYRNKKSMPSILSLGAIIMDMDPPPLACGPLSISLAISRKH